MSSKAILWIVGAIVVVGGGAWYLASQGTGEKGGAMMDNHEEAQGAGTFAQLMMRAGSWTCDVTTMIENAESEGTVYLADGKVRADFTSMMDGRSVTSHMINADGYVYTWSDVYPQGMKMMIPEGEETPESSTQAGGFDYDSQVDYDCRPWGADSSKFVPPSSVTFMELGDNMMPQGMPGTSY